MQGSVFTVNGTNILSMHGAKVKGSTLSMKNYEKPMVLLNEELMEGIYMASGDTASGGNDGSARPKCDSVYMNGEYHKPDYSINNNIDGLGCNGCPAFRENACGIQTEEYWGSYDTDNGNRMPEWERNGKGPYDTRW